MIGSLVSHYEILDQLGGGGMGVVYRARDTKLERVVALKFLPPELSRDHDANARFMQEAKAASALDHPNICTIYEVGEAEDGRLFIAMAYYDGQTLKYRLQEGSFDELEALDIARQIAEGLRAAHRKDIVHRDIKPANVMVTDDGLVKILDFGLAKLPGVLSLTQAGSTLGTAGYMSPEQIEGREVDGRTDLWSLGVVLYQMVVGRRPFEGDYESALTYAILNQEVKIPPEVGPQARQVVERLLAKGVEERYPSADALLDDLPSSGGSGGHSVPPAAPEPIVKKPLAIGAAIVLAIAVAVSAYFNFFRVESTEAVFNESMIAVMPFVVRDQGDLQYLAEGMVDLLSVKLDGAGNIRTVDPNALLGVISNDDLQIATPSEALAVSRSLGAGRAIVGNVTQLGTNIQISASMYATAGDPEVEASVVAENESSIASALDQLAVQLVAGAVDDPDLGGVTLANVTTASFPALKLYLTGLQSSRTGHWPDAAAQLEEAVQIDTGFALAWSALAWAYGWIPDERESFAMEQALAHADKLPRRARTLIEASYAGFSTGDGEKAIDLFRSVLSDYPNDVRALRGMGEAVFHFNPTFGRPHAEAEPYFRRASELDPDNIDYLIHQGDIRIDEWDYDAADSLDRRVLELSDRQDIRDYVRNARGIAARAKGDSSWTISDPATMNTQFVFFLGREAAAGYEDLEAADMVYEMVLSSGRYPENDMARARLNRGEIRAGSGKLEESVRSLDAADDFYSGYAVVARALLIGLPIYPVKNELIRDVRNHLAAWDTTANPVNWVDVTNVHKGHYGEVVAYLDALLASRLGDEDAVRRQAAYLRARADSSSRWDLAFSLLRSLEAIQLLQAGVYDKALEATEDARLKVAFRDAQRSPLFGQEANRFIQAEALRALGRWDDAIRVYRSTSALEESGGIPYLGPQYLGVADAYEQMGNAEKAIEFYTRLLRLWKDCDPELVPIRDEAKRNLDRLLEQSVREPS